MDVKTAKAQLVLAEASEKYLAAKASYQDDPDNTQKKKTLVKTRDVLVTTRDDWRNNHRVVPDGPGDAAVSPEPVTATTSVEAT